MTRINTNVSSLLAQKTLARSNAQLQTALTRLSTGLRINSGKDDPAGLIASESLRSDITSVNKGISNSQRASQMIATADSALGQVSSLLNDIRGLISEAANSGAMSADQIAANQLQIDSSLEAIDRVANTTQFQGKRLLDGSLDFLTTGMDSTKITEAQIDSANFDNNNPITVTAQVVTQATKAQLIHNGGALSQDTVLQVGGVNGVQTFNFGSGSSMDEIASAINLVSDAIGVTASGTAQVQHAATKGVLMATSYGIGSNNNVGFTATSAGASAGNLKVRYTANRTGTALAASYTAGAGGAAGSIDVTLATSAWVAAAATHTLLGGADAIKITAKAKGADFNGINFAFVAGEHDVGETASFDYASKTLTFYNIEDAATTVNNLLGAVNNNARLGAMFTAAQTVGAGGDTVTLAKLTGGATTYTTGVTGGTVTSTATDVAGKVNTSGSATAAVVTAAAQGDGSGVVTAFNASAVGNSGVDNGSLQFLGTTDAPSIRFVNGGANQALSVDLSQAANTYGTAFATYQGNNADSSFKITAKTAGTAYDGVTVKLVSNNAVAAANTTAAYDSESKTLTITGDFTAGTGAVTANRIVGLINNDNYLSTLFSASAVGAGTGVINDIANAASDSVVTDGGDLTKRGVILVNLATDANGVATTTAQDVVDYFDPNHVGSPDLTALGITVSNGRNADGSASNGTGLVAATTSDLTLSDHTTDTNNYATATTTAVSGDTGRLVISYNTKGAAGNGIKVRFRDTTTAGNETFSYDATDKTLYIGVRSGVSTATQVATAFSNLTASDPIKQMFSLALGVGAGAGTVSTSDEAVLAGGVTKGTDGGAYLLGNLDEGYSTSSGSSLTISASEYGSKSFVSVNVVSGSFATVDTTGAASLRTTGTDIDARINGIKAVTDGLKASIKTAALDITLTLASTMAINTSTSFSINGGGAQFQMGPEVVSSQQSRLGIASVSTTKLGSAAGKLYQLRSGGSLDLSHDIKTAAAVIDQASTSVATLRGRLGAFQKTTLQTNIDTLNDTLTALTDAQSSIQDADFAAESANLTRAQILVQSGTSVLGIANKNPQNVLSLLGG